MEFDKKTIIAFLFIGLILILLQTEWYQKNFLPKAEHQPTQPQTIIEQQLEPRSRVNGEKQETPGAMSAQLVPAISEKYAAVVGEGENVTVETNLYTAVFSTQGATLRSWTLKNYVRTDSTLVQLIGADGRGNLSIKLPTREDTLDTSPFLFAVSKNFIQLTDRKLTDYLEFTLELGNGQQIRKKFTFYQDRYDLTMDVQLRGLQNEIEGFSYFLGWKTGLESTEPDLADDMSYAQAYAFQGGLESFDVNDDFDQNEWDNPTDWTAVRTKYFTVATIPKDSKADAIIFRGEEIDVGKKAKLKRFEFDLQMPFRSDKVETKHAFTVYLGPLDFDILESYNVELEKMVDLGPTIFRPFGKVILWTFDLLHKFISNYGLIIILFSILVKAVLYPLTKKSTQSMRQMQTLQPLIQEINEKHKNDPQKKQKETMKMYKDYGFNPLAGCVPMLLQMPLLFALFRVFRSTIELRQASFIWWIKDLSRPDTIAQLPFSIPLYGDTINILPLFMGITMFIQQKMTMKDPKQKAMVYMMPIFLTLLFNSFPSGLNLYYALFNLLSIMQDKLMPHPPAKTVEELKAQKPKPKKRRRLKHDYRGGFSK